jgi:CrcB protein
MTLSHLAREMAAVAVGGATGSLLRWAVGLALQKIAPGSTFPWSILVVNAVGCLLIGMLGEWFTLYHHLPVWWRLLLVTGFLGGLTTFSSFGYDTLALFEAKHAGLALANIAGNLLLGLGAVWLGIAIVRQWAG